MRLCSDILWTCEILCSDTLWTHETLSVQTPNISNDDFNSNTHITTKQQCKLTTSVDIQKHAIKTLKACHSFRIACNKSAVCLLRSGEEHYIKEIFIIINISKQNVHLVEVYAPCIYSHSRWELPKVMQVFTETKWKTALSVYFLKFYFNWWGPCSFFASLLNISHRCV